jgi:hypothetical protein
MKSYLYPTGRTWRLAPHRGYAATADAGLSASVAFAGRSIQTARSVERAMAPGG